MVVVDVVSETDEFDYDMAVLKDLLREKFGIDHKYSKEMEEDIGLYKNTVKKSEFYSDRG